jgi:hypothetical protein
VTLDARGLIGTDRGDDRLRGLLRVIRQHGGSVAVPAGALGQAWRDGSQQARLAQLIKRLNPKLRVIAV